MSAILPGLCRMPRVKFSSIQTQANALYVERQKLVLQIREMNKRYRSKRYESRHTKFIELQVIPTDCQYFNRELPLTSSDCQSIPEGLQANITRCPDPDISLLTNGAWIRRDTTFIESYAEKRAGTICN